MESETIVCPSCSSDKVRPFAYGLMKFESEEDFETYKKKYVLAGCMVSNKSPAYRCDSCGKDFGNYNELHQSKTG